MFQHLSLSFPRDSPWKAKLHDQNKHQHRWQAWGFIWDGDTIRGILHSESRKSTKSTGRKTHPERHRVAFWAIAKVPNWKDIVVVNFQSPDSPMCFISTSYNIILSQNYLKNISTELNVPRGAKLLEAVRLMSSSCGRTWWLLLSTELRPAAWAGHIATQPIAPIVFRCWVPPKAAISFDPAWMLQQDWERSPFGCT